MMESSGEWGGVEAEGRGGGGGGTDSKVGEWEEGAKRKRETER